MNDRNVYGDTGCTIKASDYDNHPKFVILTRFTNRQTFFKIRTNRVPSDNKIIQTPKMNNLRDTVFFFADGVAKKVLNCNRVQQKVAFSQPTSEEDRPQSTSSTNLRETVEEATESSTETHQEPSPETHQEPSPETELESSPETQLVPSPETQLVPSPETDDLHSNPNTNLHNTDTVEKSKEHSSETQKEASSETNELNLTTRQYIIAGASVGVVILLIGLGIWLCTRRRCSRAKDQDQNNYGQSDLIRE